MFFISIPFFGVTDRLVSKLENSLESSVPSEFPFLLVLVHRYRKYVAIDYNLII